MEAGTGDDRIYAWNDDRDSVGCDGGADIARVDGLDLVGPLYRGGPAAARCEAILRSTPARALPEGINEEDGAGTVWFDIHCPWDMPLGCVTKVTLSIPMGRTLGTRRLRLPTGDLRRAEFYPPTERVVALLEDRGAKATVITYPPNAKSRRAVTLFDFEVYLGDG